MKDIKVVKKPWKLDLIFDKDGKKLYRRNEADFQYHWKKSQDQNIIDTVDNFTFYAELTIADNVHYMYLTDINKEYIFRLHHGNLFPFLQAISDKKLTVNSEGYMCGRFKFLNISASIYLLPE